MSGSRNSSKKAGLFNPRAANDWSKDDTKFGQKMLEKMGWKKGHGIGLNNQGISDNIKVRLKLDSKGLGYKIQEDQWLEVRSEFSELLSQLSQSAQDESLSVNTEKKSLEAVSQSSKTRVHYHKFTHGKDIARYKKEDLIGIFGKEGNPESSVVPDKKEFIQKGNMEEYFRNKRSEKLKITDSSFQSETDRLEMKPILDNRDSKNDDIIDNLVNSSPKEVKSNGIIIPNETEYYSVSADGVGPCENKKKNRKEKYKKLEGEICNVYSDKPAFEVDRLLKFKNVTDQNIDSDARYTAHNSTNFNDDEKHISVSKKPSKRKRKHDEEAIFQRSTEIASASVPEETVIRKKMKSKNEDSSRVSKQETEKNEPNKEIVNHETEIDTRITDKNQQKNKLGLTPTKSSSEITKGSLELHSYSNSAVISKFENSSKRKKKKSKKYDDTSCDRSNELEVSEDTSESSIILRDSVEDFMKSIVDYNTASNVEDYINQFEKNREELLNKYREKYKTKHSLSSSQNIEVYGDDFDGRKLDCQKPKPEKKIAAEDLMKKSASKAARIIAKARLMKNIQDSTVTHNFKGSNLTDICGYGNLIC